MCKVSIEMTLNLSRTKGSPGLLKARAMVIRMTMMATLATFYKSIDLVPSYRTYTSTNKKKKKMMKKEKKEMEKSVSRCLDIRSRMWECRMLDVGQWGLIPAAYAAISISV